MDEWLVFTPRHAPQGDLYSQLTFALKYEGVYETITKALPEEVDFLQKYDQMKSFIDNYIDMPDHITDLLIRFLRQNKGKLSNRALKKEFSALTAKEVNVFESKFAEIFEA